MQKKLILMSGWNKSQMQYSRMGPESEYVVKDGDA